MVGLDWEKVEGNKVKFVKNKLILDQFYFTSFSLNTPMETRYYLNSVGLGATYSSPSTMPEAIYLNQTSGEICYWKKWASSRKNKLW